VVTALHPCAYTFVMEIRFKKMITKNNSQ